ncbi:MAG: ATP synthase F1 subunit epsilon [Cytophagales bacterium]|nr:MAG: ATP synthase F1 subunit epsilon [Cytophagales bacterium]TAF60689.1 MAG: ATP synthase F1 subunit epsilon [Cytophagales bacterium]
MKVEIITPDKVVYSGAASLVRVPGAKGSFEILDMHAAIISALEEGELFVKADDGNNHTYFIDAGVVEVLENRVIILAESISKTNNLASPK